MNLDNFSITKKRIIFGSLFLIILSTFLLTNFVLTLDKSNNNNICVGSEVNSTNQIKFMDQANVSTTYLHSSRKGSRTVLEVIEISEGHHIKVKANNETIDTIDSKKSKTYSYSNNNMTVTEIDDNGKKEEIIK